MMFNLAILAANPFSGDTSNTALPIIIAVVALVAIVLSVVFNIVLKKPKDDNQQVKKDDTQE